jgi:hypothetical protein
MSQRLRPYLLILTLLVAAPVVVTVGVWVWILSLPVPFDYGFVRQGPWPIACSTRGCVTTKDWARQFWVAEKFSLLTATPGQTPQEALTSVMRQHLLHHAFFKAPVTEVQATRYREQVLNVNKKEFLQESLGISAEEYDRYVVLPFLEQEALRTQNKVESIDELYAGLSKERFMLFLPFQYTWDRDEASAAIP